VADALMALGDDYVIRWGFYYADKWGHNQGEGDFLVLGPDGNVLHIEVKGGPVTFDSRTGRYATADGGSPIEQRDKIWDQVVQALNSHAKRTNCKGPFVHRVVALPDVQIPAEQQIYETMPRGGLLDAEDLKNIKSLWAKMFKQTYNVEERKSVFLAVYGAGIKPGVTKVVLDETERMIERYTLGSYSLLGALEENQQLLFRGGPGTGKTWMAIEQAKRWATKENCRVLLLTYNLKLAEMLGKAIAKLKLEFKVVVKSYENLAGWMYVKCGEKMPDLDKLDRAAKTQFFEGEVPKKLLEIATLISDEDKFDALVVDEGQDHNTTLLDASGTARGGTCGWWEIYAPLIKGGQSGRVAIFYDANQRHCNREKSLFDAAQLRKCFAGLVQVRLRQTMRYTRNLRDFFCRQNFPGSAELLQDMRQETGLPEGFDPVVSQAIKSDEKNKAGQVIGDWCKNGQCRAEDVLILYPTTAARPEWLNNEKLNGVPIGKAGIRESSVHKAKGLEAVAVVLVGFPTIDKIKASGDSTAIFTWLMGATRVRQLLHIIERTDLEVAALKTS